MPLGPVHAWTKPRSTLHRAVRIEKLRTSGFESCFMACHQSACDLLALCKARSPVFDEPMSEIELPEASRSDDEGGYGQLSWTLMNNR